MKNATCSYREYVTHLCLQVALLLSLLLFWYHCTKLSLKQANLPHASESSFVLAYLRIISPASFAVNRYTKVLKAA